jgi:hypothetical protein
MPSIKALDPPEDVTYVVGSIQTYLVERAFTPAVAECPLDENYRSAERIVEYLRRIGYRSGVGSPAVLIVAGQTLPIWF